MTCKKSAVLQRITQTSACCVSTASSCQPTEGNLEQEETGEDIVVSIPERAVDERR